MPEPSFATLNRRRLIVTLTALVAGAAAGCADVQSVSSKPSSAPVIPRAATVTVSASPGAIDVNPLDPVRVTTPDGTLDSVALVNDAGGVVNGVITPDRLQWKNTEPLGYGRTYTVTVASRGVGNARATHATTFTTVAPNNQTKVYLTWTGGFVGETRALINQAT